MASAANERKDIGTMKLPRNQEAIVTEGKITGYLLSESHPVGSVKARYFKKIGYSEKNVVQLKEDLIQHRASTQSRESDIRYKRDPLGGK